MNDPSTGIWYARWGLALIPIAIGLVAHLLTLAVAAVFIRDCLKKQRFARTSALPLAGPLLICLGLAWSPSSIPAWLFLLPFTIEFTAIIACMLVQKATGARPA